MSSKNQKYAEKAILSIIVTIIAFIITFLGSLKLFNSLMDNSPVAFFISCALGGSVMYLGWEVSSRYRRLFYENKQ